MVYPQKWGIPVPKEVLEKKGEPRSYWGAFANLRWHKKNPIELRHDTQLLEPDPEFTYSILMDWVHEQGLERIKCFLRGLTDPGSSPLLAYDSGMFGIVARPQAGHLHLGAWRHDTATARYELRRPPDAEWSGDFPIPQPGEQVELLINGFGPGFVLDYAEVHGYLGVRIVPNQIPAWFRKQHPYTLTAMGFGKELKPITL